MEGDGRCESVSECAQRSERTGGGHTLTRSAPGRSGPADLTPTPRPVTSRAPSRAHPLNYPIHHAINLAPRLPLPNVCLLLPPLLLPPLLLPPLLLLLPQACLLVALEEEAARSGDGVHPELTELVAAMTQLR